MKSVLIMGEELRVGVGGYLDVWLLFSSEI